MLPAPLLKVWPGQLESLDACLVVESEPAVLPNKDFLPNAASILQKAVPHLGGNRFRLAIPLKGPLPGGVLHQDLLKDKGFRVYESQRF